MVARTLLTLAAVLTATVLAATTAAVAQEKACGQFCQHCVDELGIPRDAAGAPQFKKSPVSKASFRECIARSAPNGGVHHGGNGKRAGAR
ncbi:hypothetical protein [Methylobacterium oryzihabitans]|uniref:Uncharacterized protein n=1 Tax=Methylobacterium oryzihabitans TaxID=2499852 RepID=A0A3S2YNR5_9HYPH|nr:hypothetical protein [Methylobacterium oryzihabitans]RVU15794.1 hypothetical protein EOE48_18535 [Methylobacterium oryzihabitans]